MSRQTVPAQKKRGPKPTGKGTQIGVRLQPRDLASLDAFVSSGADPFTRPQAIRAILADWLAFHGFAERPGEHPEPSGPATEAVRAMDRAIHEHK